MSPGERLTACHKFPVLNSQVFFLNLQVGVGVPALRRRDVFIGFLSSGMPFSILLMLLAAAAAAAAVVLWFFFPNLPAGMLL